jgi:hypothetical protein
MTSTDVCTAVVFSPSASPVPPSDEPSAQGRDLPSSRQIDPDRLGWSLFPHRERGSTMDREPGGASSEVGQVGAESSAFGRWQTLGIGLGVDK